MKLDNYRPTITAIATYTDMYNQAVQVGRNDRNKYLVMLANEAENLEMTLDGTGGSERRGLLQILYNCYGPLCVETFLPREMRRVELPFEWLHYISRRVEIAKELQH